MYDWKQKCWTAECTDESVLNQCRESLLSDDTKGYYLLADSLLARADSGKETAQAVWMMEEAAKAGDAQAAFAMGQMFHAGWAVRRDQKKAVQWYQKAAGLGSSEAETVLARLRRRRLRRFLGIVCAVLLLAVVLFLAVWASENGEGGRVLVGKDTELSKTATYEEFEAEIEKLISEYDDELVISGQRSTNRLILRFEGNVLDLSDFLADRVIARENHIVVLQFSTEEEAQRCLEELKKAEEILYIEEDSYSDYLNLAEQDSGQAVSISGQSSSGYYSWGAQDLELDQYAAWLAAETAGQSVTVAVVDSGVQVHDETAGRILEGWDYFGDSSGQTDLNGHGTHVSGIILDCTQGLEVMILPVRAMDALGRGSDLSISLGIEYAVQQSVDVINLSLGGPDSALKDDVIHQAVEAGIVVVTATGNGDENGNPMDCASWCPAHLDECIVVGAYTEEHTIAEFSNYGSSVDLCAPGVDIVSYGIGGEELAVKSGTSMAAPHISALAAMLCLNYPDAAPHQIEKYMKDYCEPMGDTLYYGAGRCESSLFIEE